MNKRNGIKWFSGGWLRLALAAAALSVATAAQAFSVTQVAAIDSPMTYSVGDEIYIIVTFDEDVALNGDPTGHTGPYPHLVLEVSPGGSRQAEFVELAGSELYFSYTVQPGDFTADLGYTDKRALKGNNSTLTSTLGSPWSYITDGLPAPASAGSLAQMSDVVLQTMDLVGPASLAQNEIVNLTLSRGGPLASQMTVTITYPPEISGPSPVYIPANSDTVSIPVKGVMGTTAPVNVQARPSGYPADGSGDVSHALTVIGLPPYLTLEGGLTQLSEGMGGTYPYETSWTVRRWGGANSQPLNVMLLATNPLIPAAANAVVIPPSVLIPAGQDSYTFPVQARDGAFEVRIEAAASNYVGVARQMNVANNNPTIPSASVVPQSVAVGTAVTATFTASDVPADVPGLRGRWVWDAITQESTTNMVSGSTTSHTYAVPGSYTVSLYVTDKDGGMTKYPTDWTVTVEPIPYLEISGGMEQISEGPGGAYPDSTEWTITRWGAGSTGGSRSVTLNVSAPGAINLPTTVTIPAGANSRNFTIYGRNGPAAVTVTAASPGYLAVTREISVVNNLPVITGASVSPLMPVIDEPVYARYSASDVTADLPQIRGTWVWGDGTETTGALNGSTMPHTYTDAGTYTVTLFVTDGDDEVQYTQTWEVTVNPGFSLNVIIPGSGAGGLQNVGSGTVTFDPLPARFNPSPSPGTISAQYRESVTSVRVTALPEQPDANGYDSYHFQFVSDGISSNNAIPLAFGATNASVTVPVKMGQDRDLVVWFSREWMKFDNRGDIDGDGLTDEWEIKYGLNPRSTAGKNGGGGCPSGDRMPNAANVVFDPLITDPSGQPAGGPFAYPIPWSVNWTGYAPAGPAFNNRLQFRGQSLNIWDADFPDTDPTVADTNEDGLSDGWCYYFYANAINNSNFTGRAYDPTTLVNSLVIANADIVYFFNPVYDRGLAGEDTDGDGLTNLEEYYLGTNPIDWDTDGDGMPDGWEVLFGTNPLDPTDAAQNPDQDYMADDGAGNIHRDVYDAHGFDPRTAWAPQVFRPDLTFGDPAGFEPPLHSRAFTTLDEYLVMRWHIDRGDVAVIEPVAWLTWSTDPLSPDTDLDGMADGWELYVGLHPVTPIGDDDATPDLDDDGLPNLAEFSCRGVAAFYDHERMQEIFDVAAQWRISSMQAFTNQPAGWLDKRMREPLLLTLDHFAMVDPGWLNKFWPTDPNDPDTDRDQIKDGDEAKAFRYDIPGVSGVFVNERCYTGGGLNPTSADTDGDWLPDGWEFLFAGGDPDALGVRDGMDGTFDDASDDYDGDGLDNYQEYLVGTMFHFNYDKWIGGLGYNGYDPMQFLLPEREFGPGNYGEAPYAWDAGYWFDPDLGIRFFYQLAEPRGGVVTYATTDPMLWDSDGDGMDDYYELYHGLNPIWAMTVDVVGKALIPPRYPRDARLLPWQIGDELADPDQDGLPNWEEALHPDRTVPQPYHTDPTPYWITDMSYSESFVNLYYQPRTLGDHFYWGDFMFPPSYMFSFENNEGYDTDNDNIPDKRELIGGETAGLTDPLDFSDPYRRAALYLDGDAAARTRGGFFHGAETLRTWTVELWFKPEQVASGARQILIERPVPFDPGDPLPVTESVRRNFRLGIDEDGRLFVEYDNDGSDLLTRRAKADQSFLEANTWYHVAGTYDGKRLRLYINGQLHGETLSSVLPANGTLYGYPDKYRIAPMVVGAADGAPHGVVNGGARYYNGLVLPPPAQPELHSYFKGWVDEVRVWDGARTTAQIKDTMMAALKSAEAVANPNLLYHYSFCNLPDPSVDPIVPDGFASLNGRPNDGSYPGIPWWRQAADRSTVYDNYLYVHWIENTMAHVSIFPPFDSVMVTNTWGYIFTFENGEVVTNEYLTTDFPNSANPYGHGYGYSISRLLERNPELGEPFSLPFDPAINRFYNDLLPLRNARGDRTVELWDGGGAGVNPDADSNGDGIPDWWYVKYGYDPFGPSIADEDPDGDGLSNYWEYRLGSNPMSVYSLDPTGKTTDADWDSDGDGISNWDELNHYGTDPTRMDTDDDGYSDGQEIAAGTDPLDSYDPFEPHAMAFDGTGRLKVRVEDAGVVNDWTVETWVNPDGAAETGILLRRAETPTQTLPRVVDYEIGLSNGVPYVRYVFRSTSTTVIEERVDGLISLPAGRWSHVAGVRDVRDNQLRLYVNGKRVNYKRPVQAQPDYGLGAFETLIGGGDLDGSGAAQDGFNGKLDAVRVWHYARSGYVIQINRNILLPEFLDLEPDSNLAPYFLFNFDDGGECAENSARVRDWLTDWSQAATADTLPGSVQRVAAPFPPVDYDADDDGVSDIDERSIGSDVLRSESPYAYRALSFDGSGSVVVDELLDNVETMYYGLTNWTVEAWVRPQALPPTSNVAVPLISRKTKNGGLITFELGIIRTNGSLHAYSRFNRDDAGNQMKQLVHAHDLSVGSAVTNWVHLAATYDQGTFSLTINGVEEHYTLTQVGAKPAVGGTGLLTFGAPGFVGEMHEIRIWNAPRTMNQINEGFRQSLLFAGSLLENSFQSQDGTAYLSRPTDPSEDGYTYEYSSIRALDNVLYWGGQDRHTFTLEAWVHMPETAAGGVVAERRVKIIDDWRVNHGLRINEEGRPMGIWEGQVTHYTPVYSNDVVVRMTSAQVMRTKTLVSEVDIRDGQWHHLALVGDGMRISLYIDSVLDTRVSYYEFRDLGEASFEGFYFTYMPEDSKLWVADDGFEGIVDEVMFWNEPLLQEQVNQHMNYGLTKPEIRVGLEPYPVVPEFAIDDGREKHRLISYLTFDGEIEMPFISDLANEASDYRVLPKSQGSAIVDDEILRQSRPPIRVDRVRAYAHQLRGYFSAVDGGATIENVMERNDYAHAGLFLGDADFVDLPPADMGHFYFDSNNDGLPDWWYMQYGLDPCGESVAHFDWDGDGLSNYQEYLAGTDPLLRDTNGNGVSDYDEDSNGNGISNGIEFSDGDYTEDWWEAQYSSIYASPDLYDSHLDTDGDGWDNWSEARYSAKTGTLTRPDSAESVPIPEVSFTFNYSGSKKDGPLVVMAYSKQAMDGDPDAIFYLSSPANEGYTATYPQPAPAGTAVAGFVGDYPYTTTVQSKPPYGGLRQGKNWFFAFIDLDGSGTWDDGEPAGLCERFPYDVGWDKNKVAFTLTDKPVNGFVRFAWPADQQKNSYVVSISRLTYGQSGATNYTTVFAKSIAAPRNWIHEGDILDGVGTFGGGNPGLDWGGIVNGQVPIGVVSTYDFRVDGVVVVPFFQIVYASTQLPMPTAIQPYGGAMQIRPQTEFSWSMSTSASAFELQIVPMSSSTPVYSSGVIAAPPPRDTTGLRVWSPPVHWGDILPTGALTDATYRWRVRAYQPRDPNGVYGPSPSAYSDFTMLQVDLGGNGRDLGSIAVPLTARYLPAGASIRVQAFDTASFNDVPLAQKTLTGVTALPQTVILEGLAASNPHYIRAYIDQNGNNTRDIWESWGYYRTTVVDYRDWFLQPLAVMPANVPQVPSAPVKILHVDSDQDKIPDAYEYAMSGGLGGVPNWLEVSGLTPAGALGGMRWTDLDGDGLNDLQEFMLGTDARLIDTDGDGIPESQEVALGLSPTRADELRITTLAAGPAAVTWAWVTPEDAPDASVGVYATQSVVPEMERLATDVRYVLERTDSLSDPQWDIVAETETDLTSGTYDIGADMETRPAGFYRIRAILP